MPSTVSGPSSSSATRSGDFVHLHVHTEYSMLDGAARLDDLFSRTAELGMPAIAMTDHGNVFGAYEFWAGAKAHGLKPIIGLEAYATPGTSRFERKRVRWNDGGGDDVSGSGAYTHMTLWAENTAGMHNLFRLSSRSSIEGFFYKPRLDRELLAEHAAGLIGTTGCPSGEVQTWLRIGDYAKARQAAAEFQDILGRDSYFLELMDHDLDIEKRVRDGLLRLSKDLSIPVVAYLEPPDRERFHDLVTDLVGQGRCRWVSNEGPRVLPRVTGDLAAPSGRFVTALDGVPVALSHGHGHAIDWLAESGARPVGGARHTDVG